MIIVTGGAGFIGSNLILKLNKLGYEDIIVVDDLSSGSKIKNLADLNFQDYIDQDDFINLIKNNSNAKNILGNIKTIFHQGACSSTTEWDGKYLMKNNYEYSKDLLNFSQVLSSKFIYASSASVYGEGKNSFTEKRSSEHALNMYAFSKFQFDQYVRAMMKNFQIQVSGLRYFNVYGPRESHKGRMASTIYHFNKQLLETNKLNLFRGTDGISDGEQKRDFVYVDDCIDMNIWLMENDVASDIYNSGSGEARTFNDVAKNIINWHKKGSIEYIDFPEELLGSYQNYTCSDQTKLIKAGYDKKPHSLEDGISNYLNILNAKNENSIS